MNFRKRKGSTIVSFDTKAKGVGTSDASVLAIDVFYSTMGHGKICYEVDIIYNKSICAGVKNPLATVRVRNESNWLIFGGYR